VRSAGGRGTGMMRVGWGAEKSWYLRSNMFNKIRNANHLIIKLHDKIDIYY